MINSGNWFWNSWTNNHGMVEQITSGDKNAQFWRLRHKILKSCGSAGGMLLGHMQRGAARAFLTRRADTPEAWALGHRRATKFRPSRACFPAAKIPMVTARKAACAKYRRLDPGGFQTSTASTWPVPDGMQLSQDEADEGRELVEGHVAVHVPQGLGQIEKRWRRSSFPEVTWRKQYFWLPPLWSGKFAWFVLKSSPIFLVCITWSLIYHQAVQFHHTPQPPHPAHGQLPHLSPGLHG